MITFKGKQYELRTLFVRDEAKLAKQLSRFREEDIETQADAMIEVARVLTGIDIGDLNGSSFKEIRELFTDILAQRTNAREGEQKAEGTEGGKA